MVCGSRSRRVFRQEGSYTIAACLGCGLRFVDPQPSELELAALYGDEYFVSFDSRERGYDGYVAEGDNWRRTFRDRLRDLPSKPGRLLDVGAATGYFVEQAAAAGWDARGVEPSAWAAEYARSTVGADVATGTVEDTEYPDGAFDVVTMWEVIEHLPDPRVTLAQVHRILRPGGRLLLSTPDAGSLPARLMGSRWLGWRKVPEHLFFFDRANLDHLLRQSGFIPGRHRYASLNVSVRFAMDRAMSLIGMPASWHGPRWLASRSIKVNPGYDLLVVAIRGD